MASKTITKRMISNKVAEKIGITQQHAFLAVKATLDTLGELLSKGEHAELRGFGVFEIVTQRPRVGRNPNNPQQTVKIPARKVVKFRAGHDLAAKVEKLPITAKDLAGKGRRRG